MTQPLSLGSPQVPCPDARISEGTFLTPHFMAFKTDFLLANTFILHTALQWIEQRINEAVVKIYEQIFTYFGPNVLK